MMVELSAIWVVVIVLIGIAIGVYSVCKGCQGMREQAAETAHNERMAIHSLVAPYAGLVQQIRAEEAHQSRLFLISGHSIYDKNPPSYDEIIEPPPSYEETLKSTGEQSKPPAANATEPNTHINLGCTAGDDEEVAAEAAGACAPVPVHHSAAAADVKAPERVQQVTVEMES